MAFNTTAAIIFAIAVVVFFTLREPNLKKKKPESIVADPEVNSRNEEVEAQQSKWEELGVLASHTWQTMKSDIKYPVCCLGAMITRLANVIISVYMLLWVTSFV